MKLPVYNSMYFATTCIFDMLLVFSESRKNRRKAIQFITKYTERVVPNSIFEIKKITLKKHGIFFSERNKIAEELILTIMLALFYNILKTF